MEINKNLKQNLIYIAIALYYLVVGFVASGDISTKIVKAIISPIYIAGEVCFFLMPVAFAGLLLLVFIQHIRKDNSSLNWLFAALSSITLYGYMYDIYYDICSSKIPFLKMDLISLCIVMVLFWIGIVATYRIYKKGNTYYYTYVALSVIIFCVLYSIKVVYIGI